MISNFGPVGLSAPRRHIVPVSYSSPVPCGPFLSPQDDFSHSVRWWPDSTTLVLPLFPEERYFFSFRVFPIGVPQAP